MVIAWEIITIKNRASASGMQVALYAKISPVLAARRRGEPMAARKAEECFGKK